MDHGPVSNKTLFLKPYILDFFSTAVYILLPRFDFPLQKSSTKHIVGVQMERIRIMNTLRGNRGSIWMKLFRGSTVAHGIGGSIICVLLSTVKD